RLSEQPRPVRQKRYLLPAADDRRYLSGQLNRPAARVGEAAVREWVGKHERPIMEPAGEDVAQPPRRGRLGQLDHQPSERGAGAPGPHPGPNGGQRQAPERARLSEPEPAVEPLGAKEAAVQAARELRSDKAQVGASSNHNRSSLAPPRWCRTNQATGG